MRTLISRLLAPFVRALRRRAPAADAWARCSYRVSVQAFGRGSRHDFGWYLEGESTVVVTSLDELQDWLLDCEYVHDPALFNEADFWQHPRTFEQLRRGDCEDHALWAWRKLLELGYDADLVSGTVLRDPVHPGDRGGHVWVVLRQEGEISVLDAVAKERERMIRPLAAVRQRYRPEYGVGRNREPYAFTGALIAFREDGDPQPDRRDQLRTS